MINCNLAVLMAERGLNIQDVADKTKLSRTTISALYNNSGKGIQFDTMDALCELLKITPGELFSYAAVEAKFTIDKIDNITIAEKRDRDNDFIDSTEIQCNMTVIGEIKIGTSNYNGEFILKVEYQLDRKSEIRSLGYHFAQPNYLETFLSSSQYWVKSYVTDILNDLILDEGVEHFEKIEGITSVTIYPRI
ncbi:helix-turn-helix domain-containing protein [Brevibacillus sp. NRS-1366]|uniref:helix-turn-helix domain-containing protein n=1 Tax=Brevibacillus sp. NRS-1366 TaxID=3233899 RepID=UPI003D1FD931